MTLTVNQRCELAANYLNVVLKVEAPKRTGNLSINGINVVNDGETWAVVIGGEIAPYAVYTNEVWINRPGINPNQNWIQNAIYKSLPMLKTIFQGSYTPQEVSKIKHEMQFNKKALEKQLNALAANIAVNGVYK